MLGTVLIPQLFDMAYAHIYVIPDQSVYKGGDLYDRYGNLEYFADVDGLEDKALGGYDLPISAKAHSRNHFLRDPAPSSISATTRQTYQGVRQTKGAIPGVTITLDDGIQSREFQWTGTMAAIYAWLKAEANVDMTLFGPTGTPYDPIPAATTLLGAQGTDMVRKAA